MDKVTISMYNKLASSIQGYQVIGKEDGPFELIAEGNTEFLEKIAEAISEIKKFCTHNLYYIRDIIDILEEKFDNITEPESLEKYNKNVLRNYPELEEFVNKEVRLANRTVPYNEKFKLLEITTNFISEAIDLSDKAIEDDHPLASIYNNSIRKKDNLTIYRDMIKSRLANDPLFFNYIETADAEDIIGFYVLVSLFIKYDIAPANGSYRDYFNAMLNIQSILRDKVVKLIEIRNTCINNSLATFKTDRVYTVDDIRNELLEVAPIEALFGAIDREETITVSDFITNQKAYVEEYNNKRSKEREAKLAEVAIRARDIYISSFTFYTQNANVPVRTNIKDFVLGIPPSIITDHIKVAESFVNNVIRGGDDTLDNIYSYFIDAYKEFAVREDDKEIAIDKAFIQAITFGILESVELIKE